MAPYNLTRTRLTQFLFHFDLADHLSLANGVLAVLFRSAFRQVGQQLGELRIIFLEVFDPFVELFKTQTVL